jgi:hypothetical protein
VSEQHGHRWSSGLALLVTFAITAAVIGWAFADFLGNDSTDSALWLASGPLLIILAAQFGIWWRSKDER